MLILRAILLFFKVFLKILLVHKRWTGRSGKKKVFFASFANWQKIRKIGQAHFKSPGP
jgi:hypothetical protein